MLDEDVLKKLHYEETGFIGEAFVAELLTKKLTSDPITLFDYRFSLDGDERQIDCLLIYQDEIMILEVKNYKGRYLFDKKIMSFLNGTHLDSQPFLQIITTKNKLRTHLNNLGIGMKISEQIVFTNTQFYLYNVGPTEPVTFYATLDLFLENLNKKRCDLTDYHYSMAKKLWHARTVISSYEKQLTYEYDTMEKGVVCSPCGGWLTFQDNSSQKYMKCNMCNALELVEDAILRSIHEFIFLFPERQVTVSVMSEWTNYVVSGYRIRAILSKHFNPLEKARKTHYVIKNIEKS